MQTLTRTTSAEQLELMKAISKIFKTADECEEEIGIARFRSVPMLHCTWKRFIQIRQQLFELVNEMSMEEVSTD